MLSGTPTTTVVPSGTAASEGSAQNIPVPTGGDPVRLVDGTLAVDADDIRSDGFGSPWGITRSYSSSPALSSNARVGNGWSIDQNPFIVPPQTGASDLLNVVIGGKGGIWFQNTTPTSTPTYKAWYRAHYSLSYDGTNDLYTLTDETGNETVFYGFVTPSGFNGTMKSYLPASGEGIFVQGHDGNGSITNEIRYVITGSSQSYEQLVYTYVTSGAIAGQLQNVQLQRSTDFVTWTVVRQADYTYYGDGTGDTLFGSLDDLRTATVKDGAGNVLSEDYYRYYLSLHLMSMEFIGPDFARLQTAATAASSTITTWSDSNAANYSTLRVGVPLLPNTVAYGVPFSTSGGTAYSTGVYPISGEEVGGMGSTEGSGIGRGSYGFSYTYYSIPSGMTFDPLSGSATQFNTIMSKTVMTNPDSGTETDYFNFAGQIIVQDLSDASAHKFTYNIYDGVGNLVYQASPAAVSSYSVSVSSGVASLTVTQNSSAGKIATWDYPTGAASATSVSGGTAPDYVEDEFVQQGTGGTPIELEAWDYKSRTVGSATIYYVGDDTLYGGASGGTAEVTSYQRSYYSSSFSPSEIDTTLPTIGTSQNGPNSSTGYSQLLDGDGNVIWKRDPDGHISYQVFDLFTGALSEITDDVTSSDAPSSPPIAKPSGWSLSSDMLAVVTSYGFDDQGRTTVMTAPNGTVTYVIYDDIDHEKRIYPGWHYDSSISKYTTTGAVEVFHDDWSLSYQESFTYVYVPATGVTVPDGSDSIGTVEEMARQLVNPGGQVIERSDYFDLSGVSYTTSASHLGTSGSNYYSTYYTYDGGGRLDRTATPNGTISRTVYSRFGQPVSTWIGTGTDDSVTGVWSPSNSGSMAKISAMAYDVDGNLIETVQFPSNSASGRATVNYFNFRDQLIAEMTGGLESPGSIGSPTTDSGENDTFVTYYTLDNLGEITEADEYNANSASVTFGSGSILGPSSGSAMILVAKRSVTYDNQGRAYSSSATSIGTSPQTNTTNYYYDADGNLIATIEPTGTATKYTYNGAGWNTFTYITDGGQINNSSNVIVGSSTAYAAASSVANDVVVTQLQNVYDNDGNIIETVTRDRFGTDASSVIGALGDPSTSPYARVSYAATYFDSLDRDIADVNVGTNGGSSWTAPSGVPTGSSTVLVTEYTYDDAGRLGLQEDPKGTITGYVYDLLGRIIHTVVNDTGAGLLNSTSLPTPTDTTNLTTSYAYDGDNHLTTMTVVMPSGTHSQTTSYVYGVTTGQGSSIDDNDLLYQVEYPDPSTGSASSGQAETFKYDGTGEQISSEDRNGTAHAYAYDLLGRLLSDSVTLAFGSNVDATVARIDYTYDNNGLLATATSYDSGSIVLNQIAETYDGFEQLAGDAQAVSGSVNGSTPVVEYTHDSTNDDRLAGIVYPDGRTIAFNYGSGLDSLLDRVTSVSDASGTLQAYTYLGLATPVTFAGGNGVKLTYLGTVGSTGGDAGDQYTGLDRFGRIINQNWIDGSANGVDQFAYGYDADNNALYRKVNTVTTDSTTNANLAATSQLYTYDNLDRLTNFSTGTMAISSGVASISSPTGTESWSLDALGNWKSNTLGSSTTSRTNSDQNQVKTVGSATLAYDSNGNTTTDESGQQYVYDAWNRLVTVKNSGGTTIASYTYDPLGRRVSETKAGATTSLYYSDGWQVVQEVRSGNVTAQHVWSPFYVDDLIETDNNPDGSNGSLDTTFGTSGTTTTTLTDSINSSFLISGPSYGASGVAATVLHDSKIIVCLPLQDSSSNDEVDVLQYNFDGTPDTSFGTGGEVLISGLDFGALAVQSDGKILVAYQDSSGNTYVTRLNTDGSTDTGYGTSGVATLSASMSYPKIALQSDGKLLVAAADSSGDYIVVRLGTSGSVDTGFGTGGTATVLSIGAGVYTSISKILIRSSGSVLLVGSYYNSAFTQDGTAMVQLTSSGTLDTSFNSTGKLLTNNGLYPTMNADLQSDGKVVIVGQAGLFGGASKVYRYGTTGSLDTTFGTSGIFSLPSTIDNPTHIKVMSDGTILISGSTYASGAFTAKIARLLSSGAMDNTFGTSGVSSGASHRTYAMAILSNEQAVLLEAGSSSNEVTLQRFNTIASPARLYAEHDADFNITSLTDTSGAVVERYLYSAYGTVTVLNANGTMRGSGDVNDSNYDNTYFHQGLRIDKVTGLNDSRGRVYSASLGRFLQQDPAEYIAGVNRYQFVSGSPVTNADPYGLDKYPTLPFVPKGPSNPPSPKQPTDPGTHIPANPVKPVPPAPNPGIPGAEIPPIAPPPVIPTPVPPGASPPPGSGTTPGSKPIANPPFNSQIPNNPLPSGIIPGGPTGSNGSGTVNKGGKGIVPGYGPVLGPNSPWAPPGMKPGDWFYPTPGSDGKSGFIVRPDGTVISVP